MGTIYLPSTAECRKQSLHFLLLLMNYLKPKKKKKALLTHGERGWTKHLTLAQVVPCSFRSFSSFSFYTLDFVAISGIHSHATISHVGEQEVRRASPTPAGSPPVPPQGPLTPLLYPKFSAAERNLKFWERQEFLLK